MKITAGGDLFGISRDSNSLYNFQRNAVELMQQLRETEQPIVLTINGKADLLVQDSESYQKLLELVERLETITAIKVGLEQMDRGEAVPAREAFEELRRKHGISR